jgi:suppressor of G2 allele of SKP1
MSAHVLANEGIQLIKNNKYGEGIKNLSQALKSQPAPMWLLERSKAYMRTNEFDLALHDAERALAIAFKRANRDLMVDAQLRRAIVLYRMNRFADADVCAFWAIQLVDGARASEDDGQQHKLDEKGEYTVTLKEVQDADAKHNQAIKDEGLGAAMGAARSKVTSNRNLASSWRIQALAQLEKLEPGAPGRKVTVIKYPTPSDEPPAKAKVQTERVVELDDSEPEELSNKPKIPAHILTGGSPSAPVAPAPVPLPAKTDVSDWAGAWNLFRDVHTKNNSIRTDFYQSDTSINISLFVKNTPQAEFKGSALPDSVSHV